MSLNNILKYVKGFCNYFKTNSNQYKEICRNRPYVEHTRDFDFTKIQYNDLHVDYYHQTKKIAINGIFHEGYVDVYKIEKELKSLGFIKGKTEEDLYIGNDLITRRFISRPIEYLLYDISKIRPTEIIVERIGDKYAEVYINNFMIFKDNIFCVNEFVLFWSGEVRPDVLKNSIKHMYNFRFRSVGMWDGKLKHEQDI